MKCEHHFWLSHQKFVAAFSQYDFAFFNKVDFGITETIILHHTARVPESYASPNCGFTSLTTPDCSSYGKAGLLYTGVFLVILAVKLVAFKRKSPKVHQMEKQKSPRINLPKD